MTLLEPSVRLANIVMAEDSEDDRALAFRALRRCGAGIAVQVATDGQRVLGVLSNPDFEVPNLIILDVKMPRVTGIEVLKRLREDSRFEHVPIVMMTSSDEPSDVRECHRLGADAYVRKPVDFSEYLDVLSNVAQFWLSHARGASAAPYSLFNDGPGRA